MNTEAGSGLTVRALLAELRERARAMDTCTHVHMDGDTHLTVHHWPMETTGFCDCGAVARLVTPSAPEMWHG